MKSTLIINDDEGLRSAELPRERVVLGSSPQTSLPLRSPDRGLLPEHAVILWNPQRANWLLTRAAAQDAELAVNGRAVKADGTVTLHHLDIVRLPGVTLQFQREPEAPVIRGAAITSFPLSQLPIVLGRGEAATPGPEVRVELDREETTVSKIHAILEADPAGIALVDKSRVGTELNGRFFSREVLVYGDRFRIGDYFFEYTGSSIVRVDQASLGRVSATNVGVEVTKDREKVRILQDVNLEIQRGEFVGILGGSGQGKSTLLNALCGANPATLGEVLISGVPLNSKEEVGAAAVGFVPQDDIVHRELTVTGAIVFAARLRLVLPPPQIRALVERTIDRLGLKDHAGKRISELSGGQRKRVSIAIELLAKPSVLFLDEPSSGLDPATEADLMALLQSLRLTNLTVVCTTHVLQKAYLFDRLIFVHGGRVIFIGTADEARQHFLSRGSSDAQSLQNVPLEKIYSLLAESSKTPEEWEREFLDTPYATRAAAASFLPTVPDSADAPGRRPGVGYLRTWRVLLARQWKILAADKLNVTFLFAQALVIGGLVGCVGSSVGLRIFLGIIATLWFGCSNGAQQIVAELPIFRRERVCGVGLHVYLQSKIAFLGVLTTLQTLLLFTAISASALAFEKSDFDAASFSTRLDQRPEVTGPKVVYSALAHFFHLRDNFTDSGPHPDKLADGTPIKDSDGQPRVLAGLSLANVAATTLGLKVLALLGIALVGAGLGLAMSALARTPTQAVIWVPLMLIPMILFGGFVIAVPEMSSAMRGLSQIVPSFAAQRMVDVSNVYGQATPLLSNRTRLPEFLTGDGSKVNIEWEESGRHQTQDYYRVSPVNSSWQNLLVIPGRVGQHKQEATRRAGENGGLEFLDTTTQRFDVRYGQGTIYRYLRPAEVALGTLAVWAVLCYGVMFLGLRSRQTGT